MSYSKLAAWHKTVRNFVAREMTQPPSVQRRKESRRTIAAAFERLEERTLLSAIVSTDRDVNEPGQAAEIIASGFTPGETIEFTAVVVAGDPATAQKWQVTDGGEGDFDRTTDGIVVSGWQLPEDAADGQTFDVSVSGLTSGGAALTQVTTDVVTSKATVVTDKFDYMPMETAVFTAHGFGVGEAVEFQVLHIDGTPNTGHGHEPWQVVDGGASDLDGLADGSVTTTWYVHEDDSLGSVFGISVAGLSSGANAWTSFTDGNNSPPSGSTLMLDRFDSFSYYQPDFWGEDWAGVNYRSMFWGNGGSAIDPPSPSRAFNLDGNIRQLTYRSFDLRAYTSASIDYYVQMGGGGDLPEVGDNLKVQYRDAAGTWWTIRTEEVGHFSSASEWHRHRADLPPAALHANFALRFDSSDCDVNVFLGRAQDDWFIDDVRLVANRPPAASVSGSSGNVTSSSNPTFTWGVSDSDGNLASATAKVTKDGVTVFTKSYSANTSNESLALSQFGLGTYVISVTVADAAGLSAAASRTVNVLNSPPTAEFAVMTLASDRVEGSAIGFDAGASSDFDGHALTYVWNFGDGTLAAGRAASHTYKDNGTYTVKLTVVDALGDVSTTTQTVTIANVAPIASVVAPAAVNEAAAFELTVSSVVDPGADTADLVVDWGDDTTETYAAGGVLRHVYQTGGVTRTVRVRLSDEDGVHPVLFEQAVQVRNAAPIVTLPAFFTAQATNPVFFTPTVVDGAGDTFTYAWDFGGGATQSGDAAYHTFAADGLYPVTLTVTDSDNLSTTVAALVAVGAPVSFTAASQTVTEGGAVTVTATLQNGQVLGHAVEIPLLVEGASSDYLLSAPKIVIAAGQLSGSVILGARQDLLDETDEEFVVRMGLPVGASHGSVAAQRVTITDDDAKPTVFFATRSRTVDEAAGTLVLTGSLSSVSGRDVVVPVAFSGTATAGEDYVVSGPLEITIKAGTLSGSLELDLTDDSRMEAAETILVSLLASAQADLSAEAGRPTSVSFIVPQNDAPVVSLDSAYRLTAEGAPAIQVRARLSRVSEEKITVPFSVSLLSTATGGVDYQIAASSLVFQPGADEASVTLTIVDDALVEGTENVLIELTAPSNAALGTSQAVLTDILDNDIVRVSFEAGAAEEWEGGVVPLKVKLSNASTKAVTVPILVSGTASGGDYSLTTSELVIAAGATEGTVYVTLTDDAANEPPEWLYLSFGEIVGGVSGEIATKALAVKDDDPLVSFSRATGSVTEGDGAFRFAVQLSAPTNRDVTVPLQYGTGRGRDFDGPSSVVIRQGATSAEVVLTIVDDAEIEPKETIAITLGMPSAGLLSTPNLIRVTLRDNDEPTIHWDVRSVSVAEEIDTVTLTVGLSQAAFQTVAVNLDFVAAGAGRSSDFLNGPISISIPAGQTSASVKVRIINDEEKEGTESFAVVMREASGAMLAGDPAARRVDVTIIDQDRYTAAELLMLEQNVASASDAGDFPISVADVQREVNYFLHNENFNAVDALLLGAGKVAQFVPPPFGTVIQVSAWTIAWLRDEYPQDGWINGNDVGRDLDSSNDNNVKKDRLQFWREWGIEMGKQFMLAWGGDALGAWLTKTVSFVGAAGEYIAKGLVAGADWVGENVQVGGYVGEKAMAVKKMFGGYGDAATIFLDVDFNGVRSADEVSGTTSADGLTVIRGIEAADANGNSVLDFGEGQWVAQGGTDTSVGREFKIPFAAPVNYVMLTPSSTLVSKLLEIGVFPRTGEGIRAADGRYLTAFGLQDRPLANYDFVNAAARGDEQAAALFGKETQLYNTVVMAASFFEGRSGGMPLAFLADVVFEDVASKIGSAGSSLDLSREAVLAAVLTGVSVRTGLALSAAELATLSQAIAKSNRLIDQVSVEGTRAYLDAVVRVHHAAQGDFSDLLARFGRGEVMAAAVQTAADGLGAAAAAAPAFNVLPVYIGVSSTTAPEGNGGEAYLEFEVTPYGDPALPMAVRFETSDGTAVASVDYVAQSGTLTWAAGDATPKTVRVRILGDTAVEGDETVSLLLSDAVNAVIVSGTAKGRIVNDDAFTYASSAAVDEEIAVSVDGAVLIVARGGEVLFDGSFATGGRVELSGQAADGLTLFASAATQITQSLGLDGTRTVQIGGHTIAISGIGQLSDEVGLEVAGIPPYMFEGTPVTISVTPPATLNPATIAYQWTVSGPDGSSLVAIGTGSTIDYLPDQDHGILEVRMTDGVSTFVVRREIIVYPPNVAPMATDDLAGATENAAVTVDVIYNDTDLNPEDVLGLVPGSVTLLSMARDSDGTAVTAGSSVLSQTGISVTFDPGSDFDFLAVSETATVVIAYTVTDNNAGMPLSDTGILTVNITGANDGPTVSATSDNVRLNEGRVSQNSGTFADLDLVDKVTITASHGTITLQDTGNAGSWNWEMSAVDDLDPTEVTITANDGQGGVATAKFMLTIDNVVPTLTVVENQAIIEGALLNLTNIGSFTDPGFDNAALLTQETFSYSINWGDGTATETGSATVDTLGSRGTLTAGSFDGSHVYADDGTYTVMVKVADDDMIRTGAAWVEKTFTVTVNNVAATLDAGADQTVSEGDLVSVLAKFNDLGTLDTHTATINWGDGTETVAGVVTENPFGPPGMTIGADGTIGGSHRYADDGTYAVTITVTDDEGLSMSDTLFVTVNNVASTVNYSGSNLNIGSTADASGVRGQTLFFSGNFSDPGFDNLLNVGGEIEESFTGTIKWGDGSVEALSLARTPGSPGVLTAGSFGASHIYRDAGDYTVTVTIADDDNGVTSVTRTVTIAVASMQTGGDLAIGGDAVAGDEIRFDTGATASDIVLSLNGSVLGTYTPTGRLLAFGQGGNDDLQAAGSVIRSAWLYGDAGNDRIKGGADHDVLFGGDGDDMLLGGNGRDLIVGGGGADRIVGNADDDILIAGLTAFDYERNRADGALVWDHQTAISSVMAEWTSSRSYEDRVRNLRGEQHDANGQERAAYLARANGSAFLMSASDTSDSSKWSVLDDEDNSKDVLTGASGADWFNFRSDEDEATDLSKLESYFSSEELEWMAAS